MLLFILVSGVVQVSTTMPAMFDNVIISQQTPNEIRGYDFPFVTRKEWHARDAKQTTPLRVPVPYVVIHHSYHPGVCLTREACSQGMRSMQNFHMDDRKWWDIGYNFAVGGDGAAYEGRGWELLGAHCLHFNRVSLGICLIGDWRYELPPEKQIATAKKLIAAGVELGYIKPDYKLIGHRQVRDTECPGDALYNEIKTWPSYSPYPNSTSDLEFLPELIEIKKANF